MRSLGIIMLVLVALVGAFMLYILFQDAPPPAITKNAVTPGMKSPDQTPTTQRSSPLMSTTQPTNSIVGEGDDLWIQQFDPKTEQLVSEYRAAHYDPPKDGLVNLTQPEFRMYGKDGSVVQINAHDGLVVMPEEATRQEQLDKMKGGQPRRGTLNQVTIQVFDHPEDTVPNLTCTVPLLKFDNDASRINTDITEIDGKLYRGDQVPVVVRGDEYDFDGRGLIMRWNEREQRLETLEVAHVDRLLVKNPSAFGQNPLASKPIAKPKPKPVVTPKDPAAAEKERRRQKQLAAQKKQEDQRKAAEAATRPAKPLMAYLATFNDNVSIVQDDKPLGTAEKMHVRFSFEDQPNQTTDKDQPEKTEPTQSKTATTKPTHAGATPRVNPKQTTDAPATTKPSQQLVSDSPLVIKCDGKLTVNPIKYDDSGLKSTKDRLVEFVGAPVKLNHEGSTIQATSVRAGMDGKRFMAFGNDQFPTVSIVDPDGTKITSPSIVMDDNVATITGKSEAEMMMTDDKGQPQKVLIRWSDKGIMHIVEGDNNQSSIDSATFTGNVDVVHPQLNLNSDNLTMQMEPGEKPGQPNLKSLDAEGNVKVNILGDDGQKQNVQAQRFGLGTTKLADGKSAITSFKAAGNAVITDPHQTMAADDIDSTFKPVVADKSGKFNLTQIDHLLASGNVHFKTEDGSQSTADLMKIDTVDKKQVLMLQGNLASLGNQTSQIKGKVITANIEDGIMTTMDVPGPGSITGMFGDSGKKQRPMDIAWAESFSFDAAKNIADAVGGIVVKSIDEDGTINTATGKRMHIVFKDAPKTASTKPNNNMLAGGAKAWDMITLTDDVEIATVLYDQKDPTKLIRRSNLFIPLVNIASADDGSLGDVKVPAGGRMLYENLGSPTAQSTTQDSTQSAQMSGATAIEWTKSMVYKPESKNAVIDGDVVVVHKSADGDMLRMLTQRLIADFEPTSGSKQQQLKQIRAGGGATFISPSIRFDAADAKYDPQTEMVIAAGSPGQPVIVNDSTGASSGSFQEVWWSLKENRPARLKGVSGSISR